MDETDSTNTIFLSGPAGLARILAQDQPGASLWAMEEMRAMWEHQLRTPIETDLGMVQSPTADNDSQPKPATACAAKSFRELLHDPNPPWALLKKAKDFAKQTHKEAEDSQLKEIAAALYYASYAAGMTRRGKKLGGMGKLELREGFEWALGRTWLDEQTKELIAEGRQLILA